MNISQRFATHEDLPRIVEIYNSTVASRMVTADLEPVSVESRRDWFDAHHADSRPLWLALRATDIAGWLSLSSFYGRPAYRHTAEVSVYVDQRFQRAGIASHLLQLVLERAPALEVKTLLGFIFAHNLPSLALFERFNFSRWGTLPRVALLDDNERDVVIVGRHLG